jgi:hypothetical protein
MLLYDLYLLFGVIDEVNTIVSPLARFAQFNGVLHFRPYKASNGAILILS